MIFIVVFDKRNDKSKHPNYIFHPKCWPSFICEYWIPRKALHWSQSVYTITPYLYLTSKKHHGLFICEYPQGIALQCTGHNHICRISTKDWWWTFWIVWHCSSIDQTITLWNLTILIHPIFVCSNFGLHFYIFFILLCFFLTVRSKKSVKNARAVNCVFKWRLIISPAPHTFMHWSKKNNDWHIVN